MWRFSVGSRVLRKTIIVVLADDAINYHSDICKNKPEIACKLYKKNVIFRETVIEYAPHLYRLLPNIIASSFFCLDFDTIKDVCENCVTKIRCEKAFDKKKFWEFIQNLRDEFTYNHSFEKLVTEDNALKYWKIAEYINHSIPELDFYQIRDGKTIFEVKQDIDGLKSIKPLITLVEKECLWVDVKSIPKYIEFEYIYPKRESGSVVYSIG